MAELAQSHADGCSLAENPLRVTDSYLFTGESHDVSTGVTNPNTYVQDVLQGWEDLRNHYDYERNRCTDNVACGAYTQVQYINYVWYYMIYISYVVMYRILETY